MTEADGTGSGEKKGYAPVTLQGATPLFIKEPTRKRGYHRALKRGEPWALIRQYMSHTMSNLVREMLEPSKLLNVKWADNAKLLGLSYGHEDKDTDT